MEWYQIVDRARSLIKEVRPPLPFGGYSFDSIAIIDEAEEL